MTADFYPFDAAFLGTVATRIVKRGQGRQSGGLRRDVEAAGGRSSGISPAFAAGDRRLSLSANNVLKLFE
jgi:hypothetical protein